MSATAEELPEPIVTESDGKYIRVLSDLRKHRSVDSKVLDNALRYVIRVLQGRRAQVSAEVERLKAEVEQLKQDDLRWQNARDVWMSERETLKRENEALKNLANNLRPGPISMALAGRMEPVTQFEPAIPSVLCKHCRKVFTDHVVIDEFGRNNVCIVEPKPSSEDKYTVTHNGIELALPNDKWIRSYKPPGWAICLDPADRFYGWKMYECNDEWVSGDKITIDEIDTVLTRESLRDHWPKLKALRDHLEGQL